jgi:hypothetical protein
MAINSTPTLPLDYTKKPEQLVIDIINADNGTNIKENQLSFGIPELSNNIHNSRVVVSAKANSGLVGSTVVSYNRIDISKIPKDKPTVFHISSELDITDLVPIIDSRYSLKLTPADYVNTLLPVLDTLSGSVDLVAADTSLVFINKLTLTLEKQGTTLSAAINNVILRGLTYVLPQFPYQIIP